MPQDADKYKGRGKQAAGKMKETAGKVTGNRRTQASGRASHPSGHQAHLKAKQAVRPGLPPQTRTCERAQINPFGTAGSISADCD